MLRQYTEWHKIDQRIWGNRSIHIRLIKECINQLIVLMKLSILALLVGAVAALKAPQAAPVTRAQLLQFFSAFLWRN